MSVIAFGILEPITEHSQLKQQTYKFAFLFYKQSVAHLFSIASETQILPFMSKSQAAVISVVFQQIEKLHLALSVFKVSTTPPWILHPYTLSIKER